VEARAKWEAWTKEKGKAKDAAKEEYIERAAAFCQKYK
jgi:acyl-CoA-binding protein